mmetsp:Transcript_7811/g.11348  ORF Transcript_7811/g.11348 Transcript_7811/m.11348 type:complete len:93 (-) Transcript_7811:1407-1685(-)
MISLILTNFANNAEYISTKPTQTSQGTAMHAASTPLISSLGTSVSSKVMGSLWKAYPPSIDIGIMAEATIKHPKATRDKNSGWDALTTNDFR